MKNSKRPLRTLHRTTPRLMRLEPRFMFDGAAVADAAHMVEAGPLADIAVKEAQSAAQQPALADKGIAVPGDSRAEQAAPAGEVKAEDLGGVVRAVTDAKEILFIDSAVADKATLIAGTRAGVEIVVLDAARDPWEQMSQVIAQHEGISAVHLVSHGAEGALILGGKDYTESGLQAESAHLAGWQAHLSANADILLYGCDVAAGVDGSAFINSLARITAADVAASTGGTGSAAQSGDWVLEKQTGKQK